MKAILVIDIPKKYEKEDLYVSCQLKRKELLENYTILKIIDGLYYTKPIKWLPQKRKLQEIGNSLIDDCREYYKDGWNDCIDEIIGETEND